jgi:CubicO group peptidase (beta-lactamase class C family)
MTPGQHLCRLMVVPVGLAVSWAMVSGCHDAAGTGPTSVTGLDAAFAQAAQEANLKSLVVSRNGSIVRAEYFNGGGPDTPEYVWSVTKSMLSLSVGLALDTGCLTSLDQTLGALLDPVMVTDPAKAPITLRHLLTMSSGIDFPEMSTYGTGTSLYNAWITAPDQVAYIMARAMTATPGARFEYGSATIHLASVALTRACGTTTSAFADARLFGPLGIPGRSWESDNQGFSNGGAGLSLTPLDMQAIGNMVLNGGRHQGAQVVPAAWIRAMTSAQISTGSGMAAPTYGYAWWVGQTLAGDAFSLANGWGGQFICVVPAKGLVVTSACRTSGVGSSVAMSQWQRVFNIIQQQIIPAF